MGSSAFCFFSPFSPIFHIGGLLSVFNFSLLRIIPCGSHSIFFALLHLLMGSCFFLSSMLCLLFYSGMCCVSNLHEGISFRSSTLVSNVWLFQVQLVICGKEISKTVFLFLCEREKESQSIAGMHAETVHGGCTIRSVCMCDRSSCTPVLFSTNAWQQLFMGFLCIFILLLAEFLSGCKAFPKYEELAWPFNQITLFV